jgi:hypothetical protein
LRPISRRDNVALVEERGEVRGGESQDDAAFWRATRSEYLGKSDNSRHRDKQWLTTFPGWYS